jgi:hypothetical protein
MNLPVIYSGDILASGPASCSDATWFQRAIQLTGSIHTHDELIIQTSMGAAVGNARVPHFELLPLSERLEEFKSGKRIGAILRWHHFNDFIFEYDYFDFQKQVTACVKLMARLQIPYDGEAILSQARNYIRAKLRLLPFLGKVFSHVEYKQYCTESVFTTYDICGVNITATAGNQPFPAPIHIEKLIKAGKLVVVRDFGLIERMNRGN